MAVNNLDYNRLIELNQKINDNIANNSEKDEYMLALYKNGNITKAQYEKYLSDKSSNDLINTGIAIGGFLLVAHLVSKLFDKEK